MALKFALLTASLLFVLIVIEIGIRILFDQEAYTDALSPRKMFDSDSPTRMQPSFNGAFPKSEIHGKIEINTKGLRDHDRNYDKRSAFRILALGDSFVFGHGVEFEESFLSLLEVFLNESFDREIQIIKAGFPGTAPDFSWEYYLSRGTPIPPRSHYAFLLCRE